MRVRLNGERAPEGTRLWVFAPKTRDDPVASGWPDESFRVPSGTWDVVAELPVNSLDPMRVWRSGVEVKPGDTVRFSLDATQAFGGIRARAVSGDERIDEAALVLLPNGSRRNPQGTLTGGVVATLPPGTYTVGAILETSAGSLRAYVDGVNVAAHETTDVTVDLGPTGLLQVNVKGGAYGDGVLAGLVREGEITPAGWLTTFMPDRVRAGTYDLRLEKAGTLRQVWWHRGVVVRAGETTTVEVPPPPFSRKDGESEATEEGRAREE